MWEQPENVTKIICRRKEGSCPVDANDGEEISVLAADNNLRDNNLENGTLYGYWIACMYNGINGQQLLSKGLTISATPVVRPPCLEGITYNVTDYGVEFLWKPIDHCDVKLYMTEQDFATTGKLFPINHKIFGGLKAITECDLVNGRAIWRGLFTGKMYLTVVVSKGVSSIISQKIQVIMLPSIKNFRSNRRSGNIELTWDWPDTSDEVLLIYRGDKSPEGILDEQAIKVYISKSMYNRDKAYIIRQSGTQEYYFSIYNVKKDGEEISYSSAQVSHSIGNASKSILKYKIKTQKKMFLFGKTKITLEVETIGSFFIPSFVLVKKIGRQPLRKNDGIVAIKTLASSSKRESFNIPEDMIEKDAYFKLFIDDTNDTSKYNIEHPNNTEMKI